MSLWSSKVTVQTSSPSSVDTVMFPLTHTGYTVESGEVFSTAFRAVYTFQNNTEHRVTISGAGSVRALDGYIQCVYSIGVKLIKSNAVKYSFIPPGQCMCCIQVCPSCPLCVHVSMSSIRMTLLDDYDNFAYTEIFIAVC